MIALLFTHLSISLKDLHTEFQGKVPICLHGTDEIPDSLFIECIKNGVSKVRFPLSPPRLSLGLIMFSF